VWSGVFIIRNLFFVRGSDRKFFKCLYIPVTEWKVDYKAAICLRQLWASVKRFRYGAGAQLHFFALALPLL